MQKTCRCIGAKNTLICIYLSNISQKYVFFIICNKSLSRQRSYTRKDIHNMKIKKNIESQEIEASGCCKPTPPACPTERKCTIGPTGPTGPRGFMGIMGPTGATGPQGTITPASAVTGLDDNATTTEIVTKINELLAVLRAGGFILE